MIFVDLLINMTHVVMSQDDCSFRVETFCEGMFKFQLGLSHRFRVMKVMNDSVMSKNVRYS